MLVKQKIKYIQTLGHKKFREEERLFIAEGPKLVKELIMADPASVREVFALKEWIDENSLLRGKTDITEISETELERISQLTTPNKVLAVIEQYEYPEPILEKTITLMLDNIQDPGNLGTIVRIADWFGVTQVICSQQSADIYQPKAVQSTMGSIARVKVYYYDLMDILQNNKSVPVYAATLDGRSIKTMDSISEGIIIVGNESKGICEQILSFGPQKVTIPKKGEAESLNAAVATGILLSQFCGE